MTIKQLANLIFKTTTAGNKELDLVGLSVSAPSFDESMQEYPEFIVRDNGFAGALSISFAPVGENQFRQLSLLADKVEHEGTGKREQAIENKVTVDPESIALGQYMPKDNVFNISFDIEPEIVKSISTTHFSILGMKYTKVIIDRELTEKENMQIRLLFKEHDDSHSFFSGMLNQHLTKATTMRILDVLADGNLTGFPVSYIARADKYAAAALLPVIAAIEVIKSDVGYKFAGDTGSITLFNQGIKDAVIVKDKQGEYKMSIQSKGHDGVTIIGLHL